MLHLRPTPRAWSWQQSSLMRQASPLCIPSCSMGLHGISYAIAAMLLLSVPLLQGPQSVAPTRFSTRQSTAVPHPCNLLPPRPKRLNFIILLQAYTLRAPPAARRRRCSQTSDRGWHPAWSPRPTGTISFGQCWRMHYQATWTPRVWQQSW